jgi:DNA-binding transcriptional LysR family regulator
VAFSQQHPDITVNIHASNSMDEASVAEYDFAIFYGDGQWSSLAAEPLFPEVVTRCIARTGLSRPSARWSNWPCR